MKLFSRVVLPLALLIYIAVETYAKLHHTSICGSTGCKLAGQLLVYPSIYLNFMGLVAALVLLLLGWFSLKSQAGEKLFFVTLYAAIGFETVMFAYQFVVNPQFCVFCAGVYGGLLTIALAARPLWLLYALPAVAALWIALASLAIPRNIPLVAKDGTYLIHSETCPHCKKVKAYFAEHNILYTPIDVHSPNARSLLKSFAITSIPDLVIKKGASVRLINGDEAIIEHYKSPTPETSTSHSTNATYTDAPADDTPPLQTADPEGCSLDNELDATPGEESGCQQDQTVPLR